MWRKTSNDERGIAFVLELLLICLVVGGMGFIGYSVYQKRQSSSDPPGVNGQKVPAQTPGELVTAHNSFGFSLIKALQAEQADKNIFLSPPSASLVLSMAYNGAGGTTKTTMAEALQVQNLTIDQVNQQSRGLLNTLRNPDKDVTLSIANSAWIRQGFEVKPTFINTVKDYYQAEASSLDFSSPDAPKTINEWVDIHTNGKIPTIVDSIPGDVMLYLINATYFKASWTTEFNKDLTHDATFTPARGATVKRPFMKQTEELPYLKTEDFQSVSLPYGKNKKMSMYVFLPKDLSDFTQKLDTTTWNQWMSQYKATEGTITLPKFKLEYGTSLKPALKQLGMGTAFAQADFSGISEKSLEISDVIHKTYLDVHETGTEAAAVTSVEMRTTSAVPSGFVMNVNRPFFIAIRDNTTKELLFTGLIQKP